MKKYRVTIKPGTHHRADLVGGDQTVVTEAELKAFGNKFTNVQEIDTLPEPKEPEEPETKEVEEPEEPKDEDVPTEEKLETLEDELQEGSLSEHLSEEEISSTALEFAEENDLMVEAMLLKGKGSGKDGRIIKSDLTDLV